MRKVAERTAAKGSISLESPFKVLENHTEVPHASIFADQYQSGYWPGSSGLLNLHTVFSKVF